MASHWQDHIPTTIAAMGEAHYELLAANMALGGMGYHTPLYADRVGLLDAAALLLTKAKWLYGRATGELADHAVRTSSADDLTQARQFFRHARQLAKASRSTERMTASQMREMALSVTSCLTRQRSEIHWFEGVPVVPSVCPVVVLAGTSHDMGSQYAQQCIAIFGEFIFSGVAGKVLSREQRDVLSAWEAQLARYTPEVLEMAQGMAQGAGSQGVPLSYEQALSVWTDLCPPASQPEPIGVLDAEGGGRMGAYFGAFMSSAASRIEADEMCSGCAAWGSATFDGKLHFAASTDHDCTFQVTVVAFPEDGHNFIYTPFSANGSIPGTGRFGLAGHPGMNSAGVAYVHHGGGGSCAEPAASWGYGIPRGASTFHLLRYASSAVEAKTALLAMPVGNVGRLLGSVGGFFADHLQGFVLEDMTPGQEVVRAGQPDIHGTTHELLYATNNIQSPELGAGFCPPAGGYRYEVETGWFSLDATCIAQGTKGEATRRLWAASSESRNRFFHAHLMPAVGRIDLEMLEGLYRMAPDFGGVAWAQTEARLAAGDRLHGSVAHRLNAFVASGTPASGRYRGGIGPMAHRSLTPNRPGHGYFYYDETAALWEIQLGTNAADTVAATREITRGLVREAEAALERGGMRLAEPHPLQAWMASARQGLAQASGRDVDNANSSAPETAAQMLRDLTCAQVQAARVLQAIAQLPGETSA